MRQAPGRVLAVLLGVCAVLALAGPARAHVGGGAAGSNYDARVVAVSPSAPGVSARVLSFGDEFEVVVRGDTEVLVPGYSDEPYLRIGPDGGWRNHKRPARRGPPVPRAAALVRPGLTPSAGSRRITTLSVTPVVRGVCEVHLTACPGRRAVR